MRVLILSTDSSAFSSESNTRKRFELYARAIGNVQYVIIGSEEHTPVQISNGAILSAYGKQRIVALSRALKIGLTAHEIDVVSAQDPFEQGFIAWLIARLTRAKLHIQIHTDIGSPYFNTSVKNKIRLRLAKFVLPRADAVRVVSERVKNVAVHSFQAPLHRVGVLPIRDARLSAGTAKIHIQEQFPQYNSFVLVAARLEAEKNVALALQAFAITAKSHPKTALLIAGDGSEKEKLATLAVSLGIDQQVQFIGFQQNIGDYFRGATAYLLTSDYEGYGRTLIEAAAAGCPIVTTDVGLVGSILTKESALICPPRNAKCLARHLTLLLENPKMVSHLTAAAKRAVTPIISETYDEYLTRYRDDIARALQ